MSRYAEGARVAAAALHVVDGGQQHAAGAAGGVVDRLAFLRVEDLDHHPHHATWGIELACLAQRYMHLSPAAIEGAIRLLDQPVSDLVRGDIGETADR